jgi:3-deoxy-D-manno-octulosonic-acid transferase
MSPGVPCHLAPLDHLWCVESALAKVSPSALVLVETELWPTWIAAAQRRGIPIVLISARISDRSFARYRRVQLFTRRALRRMVAIGARSEIDAERLTELGADPEKLVVTGDLKAEPADVQPLAPEVAAVLPDMPLFVAGSTHAGEEEAALDALHAVEQAGLGCALAIAPRHLERAGEVAAAVRRRGRDVRLRTSIGEAALHPGEVLVIDTFGELGSLYAHALVAFVGGTLAPVGGHNVLEPIFGGAAALFGPNIENVRDAVAVLEGCRAGQKVDDAAGLVRAVVTAVRDPAGTRARGAAGLQALRVHRGTTKRSVALIRRALDEAAACSAVSSRRES